MIVLYHLENHAVRQAQAMVEAVDDLPISNGLRNHTGLLRIHIAMVRHDAKTLPLFLNFEYTVACQEIIMPKSKSKQNIVSESSAISISTEALNLMI